MSADEVYGGEVEGEEENAVKGGDEYDYCTLWLFVGGGQMLG
jgi:hypothetical protein